MKKKLLVILSLVIAVGLLFGACAPAAPAEEAPAEEEAIEEEVVEEEAVEEEPVYVEIGGQKIEPLPEKVSLVFSVPVASVHARPLFIAREKGWLEELNIELEQLSFDNGPIQMEALGADSWDFGTTGQGGIFTGVLQWDTPILADLVSDDDMMRLVVRADHPIAQAGKGQIEGYPELYGTAEEWKGVEIMTPQGTIPHFVATKVLDKYGLTEADVEMANMSQSNAFTALTAGQGELAALMGSFAYRLEGDEDYVFVASSNAIGGGFAIAMMVVNPNVLDDEAKMEAILTCLDVHFAVVDWFDSITIEEVTEYQVDLAEGFGLSTDWDELFQYMNGTRIYDFDYSYKLQTEVSDDGELTLIERSIVDPMKFFVALDKFADEDVTKMSSGYFPKEYMEEIAARRE
jgi:sulfonate transport system substrate-binding protein